MELMEDLVMHICISEQYDHWFNSKMACCLWTPWSNSDSILNSIALKCKIPHYPPHTNTCIFFMSMTNLVQPVANIYCLHSTSSVTGATGSCSNCLIMCSNCWRSSWKSHLPVVSLPEIKIVSNERLPWSFDTEMWTNLPAMIPWCIKSYFRTNDIMDMCTKSSNEMQICLILTADNTFRSKYHICKF